MTHSNHRRGDRESLQQDWIVFAAPGTELDTDTNKHKRFIEILVEHKPVNLVTNAGVEGDSYRLRAVQGWDASMNSGIHEASTVQAILDFIKPKSGAGVYTNKESVQRVVNDLVDAELGFSIVISGIFDEVFDICEKAGIEAHTVNISGETLGKISLLPKPKILEITTMCGHHFVADSLVKHLIERVRRGEIRAEEAAVEMAKQCTCNFFNVERAKRLINEYIEGEY